MEWEQEAVLLAEEILDIINNSIMVRYPFMNTALGQFIYKNDNRVRTIGTDGKYLYYNFSYILKRFKESKENLIKDFLHMILHCLLRHPFMKKAVQPVYWELAADILAENILDEIYGCITEAEYEEKSKSINRIKQEVPVFTAENVYEYLIYCGKTDDLKLAGLFYRDCHDFWFRDTAIWKPSDGAADDTKNPAFSDFVSANEIQAEEKEKFLKNDNNISPQTEEEEDSQKRNPKEGSIRKENGGEQESDWSVDNRIPGGSADEAGDPDRKDSLNDRKEDLKNLTESGEDIQENEEFTQPLSYDGSGGEDLYEVWKKAGRQVSLNMEASSDKWGEEAGSLKENLKLVNRERQDYSALLRRFCVRGEAMKVNDEEFDYIYYTYGLKQYRNMPLIEPLEYKEIKAVREFAIAIDTSGSCQGDLIYKFLTKTYSILKQQESFFHKFNVHIIQCDAKIQSDYKITCEEDLEIYRKDIKLSGFGGTDFRPVFAYVDELINKKEFRNFKGLIYLSDGLGEFPLKKPAYETVFASVNGEISSKEIPDWVITVPLADVDLEPV